MFCTRCGTRNSDELTYCTNCSAPLAKARETPRADRTPESGQNPSTPYGGVQYQPPQPSSQSYQPYPGNPAAYSTPQGYQPYQSSYADQSRVQQGGASGRAITSMILSILSPFTCGPLLSIPGMILGKMEMNAIRDGKAPKAGETLAKIGFYFGLVATILMCLGFGGLMIFSFLNASTSGSLLTQ